MNEARRCQHCGQEVNADREWLCNHCGREFGPHIAIRDDARKSDPMGARGVLLGLGVAGVAGAISFATYQSAVDAGGGPYVVLGGALVWGLWKAASSFRNGGVGRAIYGSNPDRRR